MFFSAKYRNKGQQGAKGRGSGPERFVLEVSPAAAAAQAMTSASYTFDAKSTAGQALKRAVFEKIKQIWDSSLDNDAIAEYAVALAAKGADRKKLENNLTSILGAATAAELCDWLIKYLRLHRDELEVKTSKADKKKTGSTAAPSGTAVAAPSKTAAASASAADDAGTKATDKESRTEQAAVGEGGAAAGELDVEDLLQGVEGVEGLADEDEEEAGTSGQQLEQQQQQQQGQQQQQSQQQQQQQEERKRTAVEAPVAAARSEVEAGHEDRGGIGGSGRSRVEWTAPKPSQPEDKAPRVRDRDRSDRDREEGSLKGRGETGREWDRGKHADSRDRSRERSREREREQQRERRERGEWGEQRRRSSDGSGGGAGLGQLPSPRLRSTVVAKEPPKAPAASRLLMKAFSGALGVATEGKERSDRGKEREKEREKEKERERERERDREKDRDREKEREREREKEREKERRLAADDEAPAQAAPTKKLNVFQRLGIAKGAPSPVRAPSSGGKRHHGSSEGPSDDDQDGPDSDASPGSGQRGKHARVAAASLYDEEPAGGSSPGPGAGAPMPAVGRVGGRGAGPGLNGRGAGPGPILGRGAGPGPKVSAPQVQPQKVTIVIVPDKSRGGLAPATVTSTALAPGRGPGPGPAVPVAPPPETAKTVLSEMEALRAKIKQLTDQAEMEARTVAVQNLSPGVAHGDLRSHFASCGSIARVTVIQGSANGQATASAYVLFSEEAGTAAAAAAVQMNGTELLGRRIRVQTKKEYVASRAPLTAGTVQPPGSSAPIAPVAATKPVSTGAVQGRGPGPGPRAGGGRGAGPGPRAAAAAGVASAAAEGSANGSQAKS